MRNKRKGGLAMKSTRLISALSIVTTILGIGVTLVSGFVQDKKLEQLVAKEVEKAVVKNV